MEDSHKRRLIKEAAGHLERMIPLHIRWEDGVINNFLYPEQLQETKPRRLPRTLVKRVNRAVTSEGLTGRRPMLRSEE